VFVIVEFTININLPIDNLYTVTRNTNYALDVVLARVMRIDENNHVVALWLADWDYGLTYERDLNAIDELIDKDMVTNQ
jgi:hypothetical protein